MKLNNLLTGILLAGSSLVYGQNSNENYKKISELYGKQGERIAYKNYSQIPWNQLDTNKIKMNDLEGVLVKPEIENKEGFRDSVFAEAEKLGYTKKEIEKLNPKEAVNLAVDIVASRYEYDYAEARKHTKMRYEKDTSTCLHNVHKDNDFFFFRKLGVCSEYRDSFIEVFDLIKKENKNLNNIYTARREGGNHGWNQLIILTKDSLFLSDIDPTNYDNSYSKRLGLSLEYFDYKVEPKIVVLSELKDNSLNYYLYKELLVQISDTSNLKLDIKKNKEYSQLSSKREKINWKLKENYIEQVMNEDKDISLKKQGDSLLCEYKKIDKKIDSLTTKLTEKAKKDYEFQRFEALREMVKSAFATEDTEILRDASNYFPKCSEEDYCLRKSAYYIYKNNKNKDKARGLKKELKDRCMQEDYYNTKKKFERYKRYALRYYLD